MHDGNGNGNGHTPSKRNSGGMAVSHGAHGPGCGGNGGGKTAGVCNDSVEANVVDFGSSRDTEPGHSEASEVLDKQRVNMRLFFAFAHYNFQDVVD